MRLEGDIENSLQPGHNTVIPLKRNLKTRTDRALARSAGTRRRGRREPLPRA